MTAAETAPATEYLDACPIGRVHIDPNNPRTTITVDDTFIASIKAGILEPLVVRVDPAKNQLLDTGPVDFLLIAGHRRHLAAQQADLETVPVLVRYDLADNLDALEAMLTENGHRTNLPPLDEARGYKQLVDGGRTQRQIAAAVNVDQSTVAKRLSLLKLPTRAQALLDSGRIGVKTALGLSGLIKDNRRLSKVLDWVAQHADADDERIAGMTFRELQSLNDERDEAQREKKRTAIAAPLIERGLIDLDAPDYEDNDQNGYYIDCDETDAEAFEIDREGTIIWSRLSTADGTTTPPDEPEPAEDHAAPAPREAAAPAAPIGPSAAFKEGRAQQAEPTAPAHSEALADTAIIDAAREYVAARLDNEPLAAPEWEEGLIRIDHAWQTLLAACGHAVPTEDVSTIDESTSEAPAADVLELEQPWRGYDAFGTSALLKVLTSPRGIASTPGTLAKVIAYEPANDNRQAIIDAAQARLDEQTIDA